MNSREISQSPLHQHTPYIKDPSSAEIRLRFNQFFDRFRAEFEKLLHIPETGHEITVPLEVRDMGTTYQLIAKVPGLQKEEISLEVTPHVLIIGARQRYKESKRPQRWLYHERVPLVFSKTIELPERINTNAVEAALRDGMLRLIIQKEKPTPVSTSRHIGIHEFLIFG
jgi:HSP20 family protein